MKIMYWILAGAVLVLGIYFAATHSIGPRELILMQPSPMQDNEELGYLTYRQLQPELQDKHLVVWGMGTDRQEKEWAVIRGYIRWANEIKKPFDIILVHESISLPINVVGVAVERLNDDLDQNYNVWNVYKDKNVLLVTKNTYSSHTIGKTWIQQWEAKLGHPVMAFSIVPLVITEAELAPLKTECEATQGADQGVYQNNFLPICMSYRKSWYVMHKMSKTSDHMGALDRTGGADFLVYLH